MLELLEMFRNRKVAGWRRYFKMFNAEAKYRIDVRGMELPPGMGRHISYSYKMRGIFSFIYWVFIIRCKQFQVPKKTEVNKGGARLYGAWSSNNLKIPSLRKRVQNNKHQIKYKERVAKMAKLEDPGAHLLL